MNAHMMPFKPSRNTPMLRAVGDALGMQMRGKTPDQMFDETMNKPVKRGKLSFRPDVEAAEDDVNTLYERKFKSVVSERLRESNTEPDEKKRKHAVTTSWYSVLSETLQETDVFLTADEYKSVFDYDYDGWQVVIQYTNGSVHVRKISPDDEETEEASDTEDCF